MNNLPDFVVPTNIALPIRSGENEMEQFWHNVHLLDRNSYTKAPSSKSVDTTPPLATAPTLTTNNQIDMTDDEMAAWLHYPLDDLYTEPSHPNPTLAPPPEKCVTKGSSFGFPLISRIVGRLDGGRSAFTVVDSNDTPITSGGMKTVGPIETAPVAADVTCSTTAAVVPGGGDKVEASEEVTTSPSSNPTTTRTATTTGAMCRKRKNEEIDESCAATTPVAAPATVPARIEDLESDDEKKHSRGSNATKRTRSADVHNQSERRRRDRINEKMKALQELIPRCNKSDKASMLDEAIEYMKSLQTQIQMMSSLGYGMMYAGMQQPYAPLMGAGMGIGMGMGMTTGMGAGMGAGMDMGMNRPVMAMPYLPAIPDPAAAVPSPGTNMMLLLAPRLPIPPYALPCVQPSTAADSTGNQYAVQLPGMTQIANMANLSRPYLSYQQMQMQTVQSPTVNQHVSSKPNARKSEDEDEEDID